MTQYMKSHIPSILTLLILLAAGSCIHNDLPYAYNEDIKQKISDDSTYYEKYF